MYDYRILILFYLQKSRINAKTNDCPIICRITFQKKRKEFSTGIKVSPENWNSKKHRTNNESINSQLEIIESDITSAFLRLKVSLDIFDVEDIVKLFKGVKPKMNTGLVEFFNEILIKKKKLIDIEITQSTWDKFYYIFNHLKDFIHWKYKRKDYQLSKLNLSFLNEFEFFLKTEKKQKQITANKVLQRLKGVVNVAVGEGFIEVNPFYGHKPKRVTNEVVYLDQDELELLKGKLITQENLDRTRDCFIFCCYTGLAYQEMIQLKKENIIKGFDGKLWIQMQRKKTKKPISVPLLPKAIQLIEKYCECHDEFILPRLSNQRFNSYLKEIAAIVGIKKRLTHHTARKTFATTVLLYNDVPMEVVSELLGHSSIKVTQAHYGKIVQKKVSEQMKRISEKFE